MRYKYSTLWKQKIGVPNTVGRSSGKAPWRRQPLGPALKLTTLGTLFDLIFTFVLTIPYYYSFFGGWGMPKLRPRRLSNLSKCALLTWGIINISIHVHQILKLDSFTTLLCFQECLTNHAALTCLTCRDPKYVKRHSVDIV